MVAKRLAALVAAVLLIVGAVALRSSLDNGDQSSTTSGSTVPSGDSSATITCVSDLADLCRSAAGSITVASALWTDTASAARDGKAPAVWVTFEPLASLAAPGEAGAALAETRLATVVKAERADALSSGCEGSALWACVGYAAGGAWTDLGGQAGWGRLQVGFGDPSTSALAALGVASAAAGFFGDAAFSSREIEASDDFAGWLSRLARSVPAGAADDPLSFLITRPAVSVVSTTEAAVAAVPSTQVAKIAVDYPAPVASVRVVVVTQPGASAPESFVRSLTDALTQAGWSTPSTADDGLPSAATTLLLTDSWKEARR